MILSPKSITVSQHYYQTVLTNPKVAQRLKMLDVSYCQFFGCRLVRLGRFSGIGIISPNLDGFSKLEIGPKYDPIRTLQKVTTSQIILANIIDKNEQNFSI